jgi:hypothetical protein
MLQKIIEFSMKRGYKQVTLIHSYKNEIEYINIGLEKYIMLAENKFCRSLNRN